MSHWRIALHARPTAGRVVAVVIGVVFAVVLVVSAALGAPAELPGVAIGAPVFLHLVRALVAAAIVGAVAVVILHLWRDDLPTELSATGAKWSPPTAGPDQDLHEQLVRVERESKAAIDQLAAYVESLAQRLPPEPDDERAVSAIGGALGRWEEALASAELKDAVARAISALPDREKLVIALSYYEHLGDPEIAETLRASVATVHVLRRRAIQRIRDALGVDPFAGH